MKKILVVLLSLFVFTGCVPQKPEIMYQNYNAKLVSLQDVDVVCNFNIKNPNSSTLHGKIEYDLVVDGQKILAGISSPLEVAAKDEKIFGLTSRINLIELFDSLSTIINEVKAGKDKLSFELNGEFKSSFMGFPFNVPLNAKGDIDMPKLEDLLRKALQG